MKNSRLKDSRFGVWLVATVVVAAVVLSSVSACSLFDRSLGPELEITPPPPTSTPPPPTPPPAPPPTAEPAQSGGLCGEQGSLTVLLLGEGLWEDKPLRGASAIRLVRVDFDARTVRVLALPPHIWVSTPALATAGIDTSELIFVYRDGLPLGTGSERARMAYATNVLAQTLADNFALLPNNYITLAQGSFAEMIDAMGGLSIDLPEDVDGSPSGFGYYHAGQQVMDGQSALDYVRIYPAAGDTSPIEWERAVRQRQVLDALRAQLAQLQTVTRLPSLIRRFYQDVVTDLSLSQIFTMACVLQAPDVSIEYLEFTPDMVTVGPGEVLSPNMEPILAFLETAFIQ
jgi:anionic cell wall polymer biosynthesis LytR-Cps2A-Psr (LCP) family protein